MCNLDEWVTVLRTENKKVTYKCDTGAQVNVISLENLKRIVNDENPKWSETNILLEAFGGNKIKPLGKIILKIHLNDTETVNTEFIIIKENVRPILGLSSLIELKLLNTNMIPKDNINMMSLENNNNININILNRESVINQYLEQFQGIGQFKNTLELHIQPDAQVVVKPPRRIPHALRGRLVEKLKSLEEHRIIERVEHPRSFVSNLVIIEKSDGNLRICLDPQELNKVLIREYHLIPTLEEIKAKLQNKSIFSVIDLSDGFYNIKLADNSTDLCTFSTPFGCYKFLRLPFGLSVAPEIFQKYTENTFGDIPGVVIYCDDLLICGENEEEHDKILKCVLERAKQSNVKFNKRKFQYKLSEVKYFGHIFSKEGMKIDPDRIKAILAIKTPTNKKELQIMLGMINYLRNFIDKLADLTAPLNSLLKKGVGWLWTSVHDDAFSNIKKSITTAPVLSNFDTTLSVTIQCDASKDGLGCCLMQDGKPVSYASRSLSSAEKNFSQIEKELLSVVWATKKFHYFIYGKKCHVLNDHKPLENLLKKGIHEIPSTRLQRLKLKLLKYDIDFKYQKGRLMHIADLLSRSYLNEIDEDQTYMYEVIHCIGLSKYLQCTEEQKQELISETLRDEELGVISNYTQSGWPNIKNVPDNLKHYYKLRENISIDQQLLFMNERLIIPKSLRLTILTKLHEGHLGMTKMKQTARALYYWPYIDSHIETVVKKCIVCQTYQNNNIKEPLMPHDIPQLPFSKLGIDIMEYKRKSFLVIYDYSTKWLDIKLIPSKTAQSIINALIDVFTNFGIPLEIVSDHVPFDSAQCRQFAKDWGFKFTFSSPRYPQSNGMAERGVQIAKKMLIKCNEDKTDYRTALLQYRATPVAGTNFTPSQLMMSRNLKTKLPTSFAYLKPKLNYEVETEMNKTVSRNINNYNKHVKDKGSFKLNQKVWFKKEPQTNKWTQGTIVRDKNKDYRSYDVMDTEGITYTRTSYHLRSQ